MVISPCNNTSLFIIKKLLHIRMNDFVPPKCLTLRRIKNVDDTKKEKGEEPLTRIISFRVGCAQNLKGYPEFILVSTLMVKLYRCSQMCPILFKSIYYLF